MKYGKIKHELLMYIREHSRPFHPIMAATEGIIILYVVSRLLLVLINLDSYIRIISALLLWVRFKRFHMLSERFLFFLARHIVDSQDYGAASIRLFGASFC